MAINESIKKFSGSQVAQAREASPFFIYRMLSQTHLVNTDYNHRGIRAVTVRGSYVKYSLDIHGDIRADDD